MCRPHCTVFSHLAAGATLLMAAALVPVLASTGDPAYQVIEATALLAALGTATGIRRTDAFEPRFMAGLVSATLVTGTALCLLVGPPGSARVVEPDPSGALLLGLGLATPVLLALDSRARRTRRRSARRTYAL
ncbi:hypothetical protein [Nocardioides campestrisoli]|uniref:hypothetical protein n=1 Tax=Nocardioides campestrisoli TaxID=2736757 RepID=UPI0015E6FD37|nr:hypothetical protein [Nocardioides campestrisoli]